MITPTSVSVNKRLIASCSAWNHSAGSSIFSPFVRNSKTRRVTTANHVIVKYVPDWMPGAHFKQVAKETRTVLKRFLDEPFIEVEKRIVNISITNSSSVAYLCRQRGPLEEAMSAISLPVSINPIRLTSKPSGQSSILLAPSMRVCRSSFEG